MTQASQDFFELKSPWSEQKDRLLKCCLEPYFKWGLRSGRPVLYVDCFAGKGRYGDKRPGAPVAALQARDAAIQKTKPEHRLSPLETVFIELTWPSELMAVLSGFETGGWRPRVIPGGFLAEIGEVLENREDTHVFVLMDPYGAGHFERKALARVEAAPAASLECLVAFGTSSFLRLAAGPADGGAAPGEASWTWPRPDGYEFPAGARTRKARAAFLTSLAGGDWWVPVVRGLRAGDTDARVAEAALADGYRRTLAGRFGYVLDLPVAPGPGMMPGLRMFHCCDRWDASFAVAKGALAMDGFLHVLRDPPYRRPAFGPDGGLAFSREEISELIVSRLLRHSGWTGLTEFLAGFMTEHGIVCGLRAFYGILDDLKANGRIQIARLPEATATGTRIAFWEETRRRKVSLRLTPR